MLGRRGALDKHHSYFSPVFIKILLFWQIREETDTKIELPSEGSDSDVIVITGHKAQVEAARDRITAIQNELVRLWQSFISRPRYLYAFTLEQLHVLEKLQRK